MDFEEIHLLHVPTQFETREMMQEEAYINAACIRFWESVERVKQWETEIYPRVISEVELIGCSELLIEKS